MTTETSSRTLSRRQLLAALGMTGAALAAGGLLPDGVAHAGVIADLDDVKEATIADLRALTDPAAGAVFYVRDVGQEGVFRYDSADTSSADNTGTVLVSTNGKRFKRIVPDGRYSVRWFGAKGDKTTNDAAAIADAIACLQTIATDDYRPTLYFPPAAGYATTSAVTVPNRINVWMEASLVYKGTANEACLVIGQPNSANMHGDYKLKVERSPISDWSNESCIGIMLVNIYMSPIRIVKASGFTIGVQCIGDSSGFVYNEVHLEELLNNKIGVDLTNRNTSGVSMDKGWCNENIFFNGRFWCSASSHNNMGRTGVRITTQATIEDDQYYNNSNVFHKPSFELNDNEAGTQEALPILIEYGNTNRFHDIRNEANSAVTMRVLNQSSENEMTTGHGFMKVDDQSAYPATVFRSEKTKLFDFPALIFTSGPMHKKACYYDGANAVHIPGIGMGVYANSNVYPAYKMTLSANYMEVTGTSDGIPGVFVDTVRTKRFVVKRDVDAGYEGRIHIVCYGSSGNILMDPHASPDEVPVNAYVKTYQHRRVYFVATSLGGSYLTTTDSGLDFYFRVTDEVKKIRVLCAKGTAALRIRSFSIHALDSYSPAVWSGYDEPAGGQNIATTAPTAGIWPQGKVVINASPVRIPNGGNPYIVYGWRKITSAATNVLGTDWVEIRTPVGP